MPTTITEPKQSVCVQSNCVEKPGTAHSTSMKAGLLCKPSTGTYENGYDVCDAQYGDLNAGEGNVYQEEIKARHAQSTTPYDKTTAHVAGDQIKVIRHEVNKVYWLKGSASSLTMSVDAKIITAANGLVAVQTEHTSTPKPHHFWTCVKAVSGATWVQGRYMGISSMNTA